MAAQPPARPLDPRWFQIAFVGSFLAFGALAKDFALTASQALGALAASLLTQAFWLWRCKLPLRGVGPYLSAVITAIGISVLVRADSLWVHPLLAAVACSSKFLIRAGTGEQRSHVFNPANLAAFLAFALVPGAWLSPGQWGSETLLALWLVALGAWVTRSVGRLDISLSFLLAWGSLLAARLWWIETAPALAASLWWHQFSTGSLLLFAFFMISDPMTTPRTRALRVAYAVLVAMAAFIWQFVLYISQRIFAGHQRRDAARRARGKDQGPAGI
ncbi:MAG: hypothetical protein C4K60_21185 [Ideonella sp. MAG2]|nr:MAG: hypothetical protein C4K60_21185 [Ideonella sp. MAG2]